MTNGTVINVHDKGLTTVLDIKCVICGMINRLYTSKKHIKSGHQKVYDMKTKAAIGNSFHFFGKLILAEQNTVDCNMVQAACPYDMQWLKRGKGHYTSQGVGAVIGDKSKKV